MSVRVRPPAPISILINDIKRLRPCYRILKSEILCKSCVKGMVNNSVQRFLIPARVLSRLNRSMAESVINFLRRPISTTTNVRVWEWSERGNVKCLWAFGAGVGCERLEVFMRFLFSNVPLPNFPDLESSLKNPQILDADETVRFFNPAKIQKKRPFANDLNKIQGINCGRSWFSILQGN